MLIFILFGYVLSSITLSQSLNLLNVDYVNKLEDEIKTITKTLYKQEAIKWHPDSKHCKTQRYICEDHFKKLTEARDLILNTDFIKNKKIHRLKISTKQFSYIFILIIGLLKFRGKRKYFFFAWLLGQLMLLHGIKKGLAIFVIILLFYKIVRCCFCFGTTCCFGTRCLKRF